MKRIFNIIICITVLFLLQSIVFADDINVIVNNNKISFPDVQPTIINNRTLIPVRTLSENFGAEVLWDETSNMVSITKKEQKGIVKFPLDNKDLALSDVTYSIKLQINSTLITAFVSSPMLEKTLSLELNSDVAPVIIDNRTMLPARYIANLLGYDVSWDEKTRTVSCNYTGIFDGTISNNTRNDIYAKIKIYTNILYTQQSMLDTLSETGKTKIEDVLNGNNTYLDETLKFTLLVTYNSIKAQHANNMSDDDLKLSLIEELEVPTEYQSYLRDFNYEIDKDLFRIFVKNV